MRAAVVLSYPYSGAFYYLLSREHNGRGPSPAGHPYYENLYGPNPMREQSKAVNLAALFEDIILPEADDFLPDYHTYWSGGTYYHPDLRLKVDRHWGGALEARAIAEQLVEDQSLQAALRTAQIPYLNDFTEIDLISQVVAQLRLAIKNGATMAGGKEVSAIINAVFSLIQNLDILIPGTEVPPLITMPPSVLKLPGLDWQCESLDTFAAIRQSKEIADYALGYRSALLEASQHDDIIPKLKTLMREARDTEQIANRIKGGFETTGVWATLLGGASEAVDRLSAAVGATVDPNVSVPVNVALAGAGLVSILGQFNASRAEHGKRWYLLGAEMQKVAIDAMLSEEL